MYKTVLCFIYDAVLTGKSIRASVVEELTKVNT